MIKKFIIYLLLLSCLYVYADDESYVDWKKGKIYSSVVVNVPVDYKYAHNSLIQIEDAREKAKINYYRILKNINLMNAETVLENIENSGQKNRQLFTLIDKANLYRVEYKSVNEIKVTYFINLYGKENSLMSIVLEDVNEYTQPLNGYMGFHYETDYTGIVIDARGILKSFEDYDVRVKPSVFLTIKDNKGQLVFNRFHIEAKVIQDKGMVLYSNDISENLSHRVGLNPLKLVAYGTGDRNGAVITVSESDAKLMLSSEKLRSSIKQGKIAIVIDKL